MVINMSKKRAPVDPFLEREKQKYSNPIPSREFIMSMLEEQGCPLFFKAIASLVNLESDEDIVALKRRLRAMERDGQLIFNRRGGYGLVSKMDLVRGRVVGHPDGFGFLVPDEGGKDLYLSAREMQTCLHGDKVVARVVGTDRRGREEGAIVEILEHSNHQIAGHFFSEGGINFVVPDNKRINQDIMIPESNRYGAQNGQLVVVEIQEFPQKRKQACGRIIEILGDHMAPGMEIDVAIRTHGIPHMWSPLMEAECEDLPHEVAQKDLEGRIDLRQLPLVTIDGEDSMDFDDAVYAEKTDDGWRLLVAIADVSHYVKPTTALDADARMRGNSVYFPGRVVPMLPESLSNVLCSLNPEVDRLCMVCDMQISHKGKIQDYEFFPAVMHSHARMTYNNVAKILVERDAALCKQYDHVRPNLESLYALYKVLLKRRKKRGAIDFDTTETRFVFGENKKIENIVPVHRNDAHRLIEECMLLANVAAADHLQKHKMPTLYRVHEPPSSEKITTLRAFLAEFGLSLKGGDNPGAADYSELLSQVVDRDDSHLIETVLLRSLSQARYCPVNAGHFGLSYDAYAHFTSPIRRYPDLLVHRAIRHIHQGKSANSFHYGVEEMVILGEHCSMTERRADEATRDAVDWLKCEYMLDRIGDEFDGVISSVTSFGLFVELKDIFVEGLIHVTALENDYYHFDPEKHRMIGERTHKVFRLADSVKVRLTHVNLDDRKIDLELVETKEKAGKKRKRKFGKR